MLLYDITVMDEAFEIVHAAEPCQSEGAMSGKEYLCNSRTRSQKKYSPDMNTRDFGV